MQWHLCTQAVSPDPHGHSYMFAASPCERAEALTAEERPWSVSHSPDSQPFSQSVSELTLTLHSLLITELHWGVLQTMWVEGGQVKIEYAIVCIIHSRWGIRLWYEAQILHEGSAVITVKWRRQHQGQWWRLSVCSTELRAEKMCLSGCCVNKSDWMRVLWV